MAMQTDSIKFLGLGVTVAQQFCTPSRDAPQIWGHWHCVGATGDSGACDGASVGPTIQFVDRTNLCIHHHYLCRQYQNQPACFWAVAQSGSIFSLVIRCLDCSV
mmetsp:Transcript_21609/g.45701  ORF Transcript_21609/g.45701 Transcript_21609/m.45701 type:complete len:104 (-) Transcript_21609:807-1118(-)